MTTYKGRCKYARQVYTGFFACRRLCQVRPYSYLKSAGQGLTAALNAVEYIAKNLNNIKDFDRYLEKTAYAVFFLVFEYILYSMMIVLNLLL